MNIRKPLPPPPNSDNPSISHTWKKPVLALTGTKPDRICAICLGKMDVGTIMTFCNCGKLFHLDCISELGECPLCNFKVVIRKEPPVQINQLEFNDTEEILEQDIMEIIYQCPACDSYVSADSDKCACGAIFDIVSEDIYLCPGCGNEVERNSIKCLKCDMLFD